MVRWSLVGPEANRDDAFVNLTRHVSRRRLQAWDEHLALHEVTRAPHRVDGQVIWLAPWAGVLDPGSRTEVVSGTSGTGLLTALASAVGSGATADS